MDTCAGDDSWLVSEFSAHEFLYMHSDALSFVVESMEASIAFDPFELCALAEEVLGMPIAVS